MYTRSTYALVHQGDLLLSLDFSLTPPFTVGEDVELHDDETRESLGYFMVERISRTILYRTIAGAGPVALATQEITVHLRRQIPVEETHNDA